MPANLWQSRLTILGMMLSVLLALPVRTVCAASSKEPAPENQAVHPGNLIVEQMRKQFDNDNSGSLDPVERDKAQAWLLEHYDTNHDGRLDPKELRSLLPANLSEPKSAGIHKSPVSKSHAARQPPPVSVHGFTEQGSSTGVSAELSQSITEALEALDTNGDGKLDAAERRKAEVYLRQLRARGKSAPQWKSAPPRGHVGEPLSGDAR